MADTVRSLASLQALLADNTAGDISAQDVRDFLVSTYQPASITPGGRLTTESGVGVSTSDRTSQSTIYYTPFVHNRIALYDGTSWTLYSFSERSLALSGLTSGKNYDVFLYDNSGTLTLELSAAWSSDTARTDALTTQDGVLVKSGSPTRLWLGTIRTTGTTTTEDSAGGTTTQVGGKRFVWNTYNRVRRQMIVIDTSDSWSYSTASWRQSNNISGNKVEYVVGMSLDPIQARSFSLVLSGTAVNCASGVGVDSTTVNSAKITGASVPSSSQGVQIPGNYLGFPGAGYHFLAWLEYGGGSGTQTWFGDASLSFWQQGFLAEVMG